MKKALRFSTTNFDKIAIYNNLLICYAYLKEENNAFEIIDILNNKGYKVKLFISGNIDENIITYL